MDDQEKVEYLNCRVVVVVGDVDVPSNQRWGALPLNGLSDLCVVRSSDERGPAKTKEKKSAGFLLSCVVLTPLEEGRLVPVL